MRKNSGEIICVEVMTQNKELLLVDFLQRVKVTGDQR